MKKFLITIVKAGNSGNEIERKLFSEQTKAKKFFEQQKDNFVQEVVNDNDLSEAEKTGYISEIKKDESVNNYLNSAIDPDNEWAVYLEEIELEEDPENSLIKLKADLADMLIDRMCDIEGVRTTIWILADSCTKEELLALNFDKDDVEAVLEEENEGKR